MRLFVFLMAMLILPLAVISQEGNSSFSFLGDIGGEQMNDTLWFSMSLKPEIGIGPVGVGLNLPFRVSSYGNFRMEDWNSASDILASIRYLRLGYKRSPLYLKIGALEGVTIGHGFIMENYSNTIDENMRKSGIVIESDLKKFGGEFLYSNLGKPEITGIRAFVRPIKFVANIPIVSNFELGSTYLTDLNPDLNNDTKGAIGFLGFDVGLPILTFDMLSWEFYFDYANMNNYGSGNGLGTRLDFHFIMNLLTLSAKFERRSITDQFLPSYFDPFYEAQKIYKENIVREYNGNFYGYAGELYANALGKLQLTGRYTYFINKPKSGKLAIILDATKFIPDTPILIAYNKCEIEKMSDMFEIDSSTVFTLSVSRKIYWKIYGTVIAEQKYAYDETNVKFDELRKYALKLGIRL